MAGPQRLDHLDHGGGGPQGHRHRPHSHGRAQLHPEHQGNTDTGLSLVETCNTEL